MDNKPRKICTFTQSERLKSQKLIGELFKGGHNSLVAYPLRVVWKPMDAEWFKPDAITFQLMISVPKRSFKTAVQRNRLKRQIREAWRLNKSDLIDKTSPERFPVAIMLQYIAKEALPYSDIEGGVKKLVRKWGGDVV